MNPLPDKINDLRTYPYNPWDFHLSPDGRTVLVPQYRTANVPYIHWEMYRW